MTEVPENISHRVFILESAICLEHRGQVIKRISIDEIKLIAEYTNDRGPFEDDWYLSIYYKDSEYFEFSMYTNEIMEMIKNLGNALNYSLIPSLSGSTDWKSSILYPQKYSDQPVWIRKKMNPKSILEKLRKAIGFSKYELEIQDYAAHIIDNPNS
jgi:hypothetical protein